MGTVYRIGARAAEGISHYRRAGEAWPRDPDPPREVLVIDADDDPPGRLVDGHFAIGRGTLAILRRDSQLLVEADADFDRTADVLSDRPPAVEGSP